jgi:formylmethanofuran dehydrogenase subunit E
MVMNAMQKALVSAGLAKEPKSRKRRGKQFSCNRCGETMIQYDDVNVMVCPNCDRSYFIFSNK